MKFFTHYGSKKVSICTRWQILNVVTIHMWLITQPPLKDICKRKKIEIRSRIYFVTILFTHEFCVTCKGQIDGAKFGWIQAGQDVNKVEVLWCFGMGLLVGKLSVHGKFQIVLRRYFCWSHMWNHVKMQPKAYKNVIFIHDKLIAILWVRSFKMSQLGWFHGEI